MNYPFLSTDKGIICKVIIYQQSDYLSTFYIHKNITYSYRYYRLLKGILD